GLETLHIRMQAQSANALDNTSIFIIDSSEAEKSKKGVYPDPMYRRTTKGAQNSREIWLKLLPHTTKIDFELTSVHELTHMFDSPVFDKIAFERIIEEKLNSRIIGNLRACFRAANRNARGKNPLSLALDYSRIFFSRLRMLSGMSDSTHEQALALSIVKEGRARFCSIVYLEGEYGPDRAHNLISSARNNVISGNILGMPQSPYDIGLAFMANLSSIVGTDEALAMTYLSPPTTLADILNPEKYAAEASKQLTRTRQAADPHVPSG
ncbi:MAG TPA: hypothetical protein PLO51_06190, partial [Candidatus Micrarchaeota archaeon]|nr:hypothetical protein [Candidatus Micrarchaeota archaeon]